MAGKIDRRALIKGATVVGGTLWALPVIETVGMPAAAAGSAPPGGVLPGSVGGTYVPVVGAQPALNCVVFTKGPCNPPVLPENPTGACAVTTVIAFGSNSFTLGVLKHNHLVYGASYGPTATECVPAVPVTMPLVSPYGEFWEFFFGADLSSAALVVVPTP
jgi:hypothetical protein